MRRQKNPNPAASVKIYSVGVRQAADRVGVSMETVKRWARSGRIDARKNTSGNWVFAAEDLDAMRDRDIVIEVQS